ARDLRAARRAGIDARRHQHDTVGRRLRRSRFNLRGRFGFVSGPCQPAGHVDLGGRHRDHPWRRARQPGRGQPRRGVGKAPRPRYPPGLEMAIIVATLLLFLAGPFVLWPLLKTPEDSPEAYPPSGRSLRDGPPSPGGGQGGASSSATASRTGTGTTWRWTAS